MFISFIQNISLLISLSVVHTQVIRRWQRGTLASHFLSGLLFGTVGVLGMATAIVLMPGVIFDGRSIILSLAGLLGGPLTAVIAAAFCALYRLQLGGPGMWVGLSVIFQSTAFGVLFYYLRHRYPGLLSPLPLFVFGLLVNLTMLLLFFKIPELSPETIISHLAGPILLFYPLATVLLGLLFLDQEKHLLNEEKLAVSEERFRAISELALDAILVIDAAGAIVYFSPAAEKMFGYSADEAIGKDAHCLLLPERHRRDYIEVFTQFKETGQGKAIGRVLELTAKHKNGQELPIEIAVSPMVIQGKIWTSAIIRDIRGRKEVERKLADYTLELEELYRRLGEEVNKARQVHERILPKSFPVIPGLSFAAHYQPAEVLGGDFYDVLPVGGKLAFYLSDVSGHGLDGAMLSVFVKHTVKSYVSSLQPEKIAPAAVLRHLAEHFCEENYPEDLYICIFLAVLDLSSLTLSYCGAGFQEPLLVLLGSGEKLELRSRGMFMTSFLPLEVLLLEEKSIALDPGATLFCATDGLAEQGKGGTYYGRRVQEVFFRNAHLPAHLVAQAVVEDFRRFNGGSLRGKDDITFLVLQLDPAGGG